MKPSFIGTATTVSTTSVAARTKYAVVRSNDNDRNDEFEDFDESDVLKSQKQSKTNTSCDCWSLKKLVIALLLTMFLMWAFTKVFLASYGVVVLPFASGLRREKVCNTQGCVLAAASIISSIDTSVDPCEDFYQFACGKWNRENPIPDDRSKYSSFSAITERVTLQMKGLLETPDPSSLNSSAVNMTRILYNSCMNLSRLSVDNSSRLFQALRDLGSLPMLDPSWSSDKFNFSKLITKVKKFHTVDVFWDISVYADEKNTNRTILHVDQASLALGTREYYLNATKYADVLQALKTYMMDVAKLIASDAGVQVDPKVLEEDVENMVEFEAKIANLTTPNEDRRNGTALYNIWTLRSLKDSVAQINWDLYFQSILPRVVRRTLNDNIEINVMEPRFLEEMQNLLQQTDKRTLANFILWKVVEEYVASLDERFLDVSQKFTKVFTGRQQRPAKWKSCVGTAISYVKYASSSMYVRKYFDGSAKTEGLEMIRNLFASFDTILDELSWMDEETISIARNKLRKIIPHIGFPDFVLSATELDNYYAGLEFSEADSSSEISRKVSLWHQNKRFNELLKPFDRNEFGVSSAVVNAFYSPQKNAIVFPAGILQPPFFAADYPKAINYGAIGAVIGHEITHAFDDHGSQYDEDGNLKNWWSSIAQEGFRNRTKCIIDQYGSYQVKQVQMKINGKLTQGENIADNGGLKEAYRAYRKYISDLGNEEPKLPGLGNMTNNQVFFVSFAGFWCGTSKKQQLIQQLLGDSHSPAQFRVIGTLSNNPDFARAFNCKSTSFMNPTNKCEVW